MLSGSEAVESAVKIARKWAYVKKGVTADEAWILTTDRCYHGITLATMPLSNIIAQGSSHLYQSFHMSDASHKITASMYQRWGLLPRPVGS